VAGIAASIAIVLYIHIYIYEYPTDDYGVNASINVVQCNGFMPLIRYLHVKYRY